MNETSQDPLNMRTVLEIAGFVAVVSLVSFVGAKAGMRGAGLLTMACGLVWVIDRRIPYGIEGRPPAGHIRGRLAVALGVAMGAAGVTMLCWPQPLLVLLRLTDV